MTRLPWSAGSPFEERRALENLWRIVCSLREWVLWQSELPDGLDRSWAASARSSCNEGRGLDGSRQAAERTVQVEWRPFRQAL
jgi:hypothetical protein